MENTTHTSQMTAAMCAGFVQPRVSKGIMGKGRESFTLGLARPCKRHATDGIYCHQHAVEARRIASVLAARKAAQ